MKWEIQFDVIKTLNKVRQRLSFWLWEWFRSWKYRKKIPNFNYDRRVFTITINIFNHLRMFRCMGFSKRPTLKLQHFYSKTTYPFLLLESQQTCMMKTEVAIWINTDTIWNGRVPRSSFSPHSILEFPIHRFISIDSFNCFLNRLFFVNYPGMRVFITINI